MNFISRITMLDLRSLAVMRIVIGLLLLQDMAVRLFSVRAFLTAEGVLPLSALPSPAVYFRAPLHALSDSAAYQYAVLIILILLALLLISGVRYRVVTFITWLMLASLHERNILILHSSDTILRLTLFWGIFLPWGERFSFRGKGQSRDDSTESVAGLVSVGYMLQITCIYAFSVAFKTGADWRSDFTAVYYALQVGEFGGNAASWLAGFPGLTKILTVFVLITELFAPLLIFIPRLRLVGVAALLLMHAGFAIFLNLGPFPLIASASLLGLLPASVWRWIDERTHANTENVFWQTARCQNVTAGVMIICVLGWNLLAIPQSPYKATPLFIHAARILHFDQNWAMFSPQPPHTSGWITTSARMRFGGSQDIWNSPLVPDKPSRQQMRRSFGDWRWFKYLQNLVSARRNEDLQRFAAYLCQRTPSAAHVEVFLHQLPSGAPGEQPAMSQRQLLTELACKP